MAKIQRKQQKIFAGLANTDEKAVFGSMKTGTPVYSNDIEQLQSADYEQGWQNSIVLEKAPFLEEMNGVQYGLSSQIAYLLQQGIPEWDSETTYYTNGFCSYNGVIYRSLVDENIGNIPSSTQLSWEEFTSGSEGDSLNDKITNCILSNSGASITKQDYVQQSYVNKDCNVTDLGAVSGFSATAYIILNRTFTNSSVFTFTIPFTLNSTAGVQPLAAINDTANSIAVVNGVLRFNYMGETLNGSTTLAASTAYTLQFARTDSGYTVQIKAAADEDYTQEINLPSSLDYFSGKTVYLGSDRVNALDGTIDLENVTIQADNATYWDINTLLSFQTVTLSGALDTLMPDGRKEDLTLNNLEQSVGVDTTLLLNNSTGQTKTILIKDNNEVMIRDNYTESDNEPSGAASGDVWFDTAANQMKEQQVVLPNLINSGCLFADGVASNFSQTNYLQLPSTYNLGSNWSMSLPVNLVKNDSNSHNVIVGDLTIDDDNIIPSNVAVVYDGDSTVTAYLRRDDVYVAQKQQVVSTAYAVTSGETVAYTSVAGESGNYVPEGTQLYSDSRLQIQLSTAAANTWTYNGETFDNISTVTGYVKPSGSVFVPSGTQVYTTADLTTPLEVSSGTNWVYTGATAVSMIGALNETVQARNVTINGGLSNNDGVLSGFSTTNYATIPTFQPGSQPWEMVWCITTGTIGTTQTFIWNGIFTTGSNRSIGLGYTHDGYFRMTLSTNGTSETGTNGSYTVLSNTKYWLKMAWDGTAYTVAYSLTGEENSYTTDITVNNSSPIFDPSPLPFYIGQNGVSENLFTGSIDLNESYIKINNEMWWQYQSGDKALELAYDGTNYTFNSQTLASTDTAKDDFVAYLGSAPSTPNAYFNSTIDIANASFSFWNWNGISDIKPNYAVSGNVTFNDNIMTVTSSSGQINANGTFDFSGIWYVNTQFTTGPDVTTVQRINRNEAYICDWGIINSRFNWWVGNNGTGWNLQSGVTGSYTVLPNTTYYVEMGYDGTQYYLGYSLTGEPGSYVRDLTVSGGANTQTNVKVWWGSAGREYFRGQINLNGLVISTKGNTVWRWNGVTEAGRSWNTFPAAKVGYITMKPETVQPNIRIDGSLTNNNGVFSGFSTTNNIYCDAFTLSGNETIEYIQHFTTPSTFATANSTAHIGIGTEDFKLFDCTIDAIGHPLIFVSSNGTDWNVAMGQTSDLTLNTNTAYYGRVRYDGTNIYQEYSTDGKSYTTYNTVALSSYASGTYYLDIGVWERTAGTAWYWAGSQDLNATRLYINDDLAFAWNGLTSPTTQYVVDQSVINYPVELVKKEDLEKVETNISQQLYPIGRPIMVLPHETLEDGEVWLEGAIVSRTTYINLFRVYGTTYGAGDGSTTFQLPDWRNRTTWGSGDATSGYVSAGLPNIIGGFSLLKSDSGDANGAFYISGKAYVNTAAANGSGKWVVLDAARSSSIFGGSTTVQPSSIKVRFKTRYR